MQVSELAKDLGRFNSHLSIITKRYGVLTRMVARYFRSPRVKEAKGLTIRTHPAADLSRKSIGLAPSVEQSSQSSTFEVSSIQPPSTSVRSTTFPILPLIVPRVFENATTRRAAIFFPKTAQFDLNKGHFVPSRLSLGSRMQTAERSKTTVTPPKNAQSKIQPVPLSPNSNISTNSGELVNQDQPKAVPIQLSSTAKRLMQVVAGLPFLPLAFIGPPIAMTGQQNSTLQNSQDGLKPRAPAQVENAPNVSTMLPAVLPTVSQKLIGLSQQTVSLLQTHTPTLRIPFRSIPVLGSHMGGTVQAFSNLTRADRLTRSTPEAQAVPRQRVHSGSLPLGPQQNLSQIISAYGETESYQARSALTNRSIRQILPEPVLPSLQPQSRSSLFTSLEKNNLPGSVVVLPSHESMENQAGSSLSNQDQIVPRLSSHESDFPGFGEADDTIAMDELRSKISKILAEEMRRHIPGD